MLAINSVEEPLPKLRKKCKLFCNQVSKLSGLPAHYSDILGISGIDFPKYLLQTYEDTYGYPWDGIVPVEIDHIIPRAAEGWVDKTKLDIWNYKNLRLIKERDNREKSDKLDYEIKLQR